MNKPNELDESGYPKPAVAWYTVGVLSMVYMFSFIDRQILVLLIDPVKNDLQITDTQVSLLTGLAFAVLYAVMGVPAGRAADRWSRKLVGWDRLRYITNCFTRMRYCDRKGRLELTMSGRPGHRNRKFLPWFRVPERENNDLRIVFGHWSTLGPVKDRNVFPLDTGCVWGGALTALRLDKKTPRRIDIRCRQAQRPR